MSLGRIGTPFNTRNILLMKSTTPCTTLTSSRRAAKLCTMSGRLWSHIEARDLWLQGITMAIGGIVWESSAALFGVQVLHLHFLSFPCHEMRTELQIQRFMAELSTSWNQKAGEATADYPKQSKVPPRTQSSGWHVWKPETVWNTAIVLVKYINRYQHSKPWPLASINRSTENAWNNDPRLLFGSTIL